MKKMSYDEALEEQKTVKSSIKELRGELKDYLKENKVTAKEPATGKVLKSIEAKEKKIEAAKKTLSEINDFIKENKPVKVRETKYNYPDWAEDSELKKKFRTLVRSGVAEKDVTLEMAQRGKRAVLGNNSEKAAAAKKVDKGSSSKKSKKETKTPADAGEDVAAPVKKSKKGKKGNKKKKSSDD